MTYLQLEQNVITRLQTLAGPNLSVLAFPETDKDFERSVTRTLVEVMYHSSVFPEADFGGRPGSMVTDGVEQQEYARVAVLVRGAKLRGTGGVMAALSAVKSRLLGFRPSGAQTGFSLSKVEPGGSQADMREGGVWQYTMLWGCSLVIMGEIADETGPAFQAVGVVDESFGDFTVPDGWTPPEPEPDAPEEEAP